MKNDQELINSLKNDNSGAFDIIYKVYYTQLCNYIYSFSRNSDIAEDIVQEILLNFWENRKTINIHTSIKSYLYKSTYYSYIDHYRKKKNENKQLEIIRFNAIQSLVDYEDVAIEDKLIQLRIAIDSLPPKGKEIFKMSKIQGYKYKEIADILNISVNTVEAHMYKSLKFLRIKLNDKKNEILELFISFIVK
ncbi:RNA polymerase sigma-70 factor [Lutibacter sp. A80]|uniref:RNA polymerase sigma factor n=1 Tax=Lutibacter sp. A80 TaxID=2918453 RepID=UPI001F06EFE7|nr:RNA polymerase sigma-70 factor [Lutibacter sp. A80]UMB62024.1 RNA polymerase sigma-70 factor [Lutibacter sp. A80]